jgi:hypothetical protein
MVTAAYEKHRATLTREDDGDDQLINEIMSNPTFTAHLDEVRGKLVKQLGLINKKAETDYSPSLSACNERSRGKGGAAGSLFYEAFGHDFIRVDDVKVIDSGGVYRRNFEDYEIKAEDEVSSETFIAYSPIGDHSELMGMSYYPKLVRGRRLCYDQVVEHRSMGTYSDRIQDWSGLMRKLRTRSRRSMCASIQGIVEPLKVRVISKGPALEYYGCKRLQECLHTVLREMSCYRLIGRPLSPTDLIDLHQTITRNGLQGNEEWISVDYSAATDNLSWKYSSRIFQYILQDLPEFHRDLAMSVLGPHHMTYPRDKETGTQVEPGLMKRGQLMGSILSFPILCLANLGLYLRVTQESQRNWTDKQRLDAVLVNGDDMLYVASPDLFYKHIDFGRKVGLDMTVGKAYHHPRFANINSTCFDSRIGSNYVRQIDYLNTGLFFGQHKVLAKKGDDNKKENDREVVVKIINTVLTGSLPGKQRSLLKQYLALHKDEIEPACRLVLTARRGRSHISRNIFLPECCGGMGVTPPVGWRFKITRTQRKLAYVMNKAIIGFSSTQHPLPRPRSLEVRSSVPVIWAVLAKDLECPSESEGIEMIQRIPKIFSAARIQLPFIPFGRDVAICA